ncbi:MAG: SPOR domain-containing protein [Desulfohalobiaceae bacterium]|nr:SPOR domain-containing protein [Desulfohalobiaceae bacterium]
MAEKKKKRSSGKKKSNKPFTVTLGWSGLFSVVLLIGIALVWAFIFGVIVGRGYQPESFWPALSKVLPQKEQGVESQTDKQRGESLRAEELGFINSLASPEEPPSKPQKAQEREKQETQEGQPHPVPEDKDLAGKRHVYRYQVAALQSNDRAKKVVQKLKAKGVRVDLREVDKDGDTWYRIHVLFTGEPEEAKRFKRRLEGFGLGTPFLRDKAELK